MTSLKFVNDRIRSYETMLLTAIDTKCSEEQIKHYEERLNVFKQIKNELESLKLIKDKLILSVEKETSCFNEQDITGCWLVQGRIVKCYTIIELNEYEILKEALEVEK